MRPRELILVLYFQYSDTQLCRTSVFAEGLVFGYFTRYPTTNKQGGLPIMTPEPERETDESKSPR
jgi:hypothetical protein